VPFSATTGRGRDELASALVSLLAEPDWRNSTEGETSDGETSDGETSDGK